MNDRINIVIEDGVADVRFNRPDKMNALDPALLDGIVSAGDTLRSIQGLHAVVLSGEGRAFCAGLDLTSFSAIAETAGDLMQRSHGISNIFQHAAMLWRELPVPVIAAIHGVCFGGGLQIALGADIRIAAPDTKLSVMEIKWGVVPDMGGFVLTRGLVRGDVLRDLVYSGRQVEAAEAQALGLITHLSDTPHATAMTMARNIAAKNPDAIRAAKRLFDLSQDKDLADVLLAESREQMALFSRPNQKEAVTANMEKRAPVFSD
ncbi:crotonase/enoyl-CoA hydratase family protein [Rhizorhapis sp. SPR117]|uniref:crotonase/enoyl-CoA hydratase family protein n=1 Tax=Rhizorhapis sp. SPR117 TaxID=2912611 RepID=UPI001F008F19|nr:crotonase/enoyl-CoA hydratase family protein [Rhizorhapis sp. SPR117]